MKLTYFLLYIIAAGYANSIQTRDSQVRRVQCACYTRRVFFARELKKIAWKKYTRIVPTSAKLNISFNSF